MSLTVLNTFIFTVSSLETLEELRGNYRNARIELNNARVGLNANLKKFNAQAEGYFSDEMIGQTHQIAGLGNRIAEFAKEIRFWEWVGEVAPETCVPFEKNNAVNTLSATAKYMHDTYANVSQAYGRLNAQHAVPQEMEGYLKQVLQQLNGRLQELEEDFQCLARLLLIAGESNPELDARLDSLTKT